MPKNGRKTIVMKFGGTSLSTPEHIKKVARYVAKESKSSDVVAVVSAMGKTTDGILKLFGDVCLKPPDREIDHGLATGEQLSASLLAAALASKGVRSRSLSCYQMRLIARGPHGNGKIVRVQNLRYMRRFLKSGHVLVCAGFQGVDSQKKEIYTLGRGGSDTSAVSLAYALKAHECRIFTDVDGVYSVDPRVVPTAKRFPKISHRQMLSLSSSGAGVLHDRCVLLALELNMPIQVLLSPSFGQSRGGTRVLSHQMNGSIESEHADDEAGIAIRNDVAVITMHNIPNSPGKLSSRLKHIQDIMIGDAIQSCGNGTSSVTLWVKIADSHEIVRRLNRQKIKATVNLDCSCLTLVSPSMEENPGYLYRVSRALGRAKSNIMWLSSSGSSILAIVKSNGIKKAALALAREFSLCE